MRKRKTVWAYLDGKKLVDVVQAALDNNMMVDDLKKQLIRRIDNPCCPFYVSAILQIASNHPTANKSYVGFLTIPYHLRLFIGHIKVTKPRVFPENTKVSLNCMLSDTFYV